MKIAVNMTHRGKHPAGMDKAASDLWWRQYNGGFKNHDLTPEELSLAIAEGHGYTTQHTGYRKAANFITGQHIGLDFDDLPASDRPYSRLRRPPSHHSKPYARITPGQSVIFPCPGNLFR